MDADISIGHFRVSLCLCFNASLSPERFFFFIYESDFDLHESETACRTHFHHKLGLERFHTLTRLETEAQEAYWSIWV